MAPKKQTTVEQTPAPAPVEEKKTKKADSKKAETPASSKKADSKKTEKKAETKTESKKAEKKATEKKPAAPKKAAEPREKRPKPTKESFLNDLQAAESKLAEVIKQLGELKMTEAKKIVNEFYRQTFSDIVKDSKKVKELKVKNNRTASQVSGLSNAVAISAELAAFCQANAAKVVAYMKGEKKYEGKDIAQFSQWSTKTDASNPDAGKHSRTKVTTFLCAYIALNNLKDPENMRFITFDEPMAKLFHVTDKKIDTITEKNKGNRWTFTSLQSLLKHCNHYPK